MKTEQTTTYRCEYCGHRRLTKRGAESHERWCRCRTCTLLQVSRDEPAECGAGVFPDTTVDHPWQDVAGSCPHRVARPWARTVPAGSGEEARSLLVAAARYCAARDREAEILRQVPGCEAKARQWESPLATWEDGDVAGAYCSAMWGDRTEHWCPTCRAALPLLQELRRVRRSLGGLMRAMRAAARSS